MNKQFNHSSTESKSADFVIKTNRHYWAIPYDCGLLKLLLKQQRVQVSDLQFESAKDCHDFIKTLFLMALEDECQTQQPSMLAEFGRDLMQVQSGIHTL